MLIVRIMWPICSLVGSYKLIIMHLHILYDSDDKITGAAKLNA